MTNYDEGFRYIAQAFAEGTLPEDEGKWEVVGPPACDHSLEQVLDHFAGCEREMPSDLCQLLGLPDAASYHTGAERIGGGGGRTETERTAKSPGKKYVQVCLSERPSCREGRVYVEVPATWTELELIESLRGSLVELVEEAEWLPCQDDGPGYGIDAVDDVDDDEIEDAAAIVRLT